MNTLNGLDWRDVEMGSPADSDVRTYPRHVPFPLVHRIHEPDDDIGLPVFFAPKPVLYDTFDDLVDEREALIWRERRYRRAIVKTLAALTLAAVAAIAVLAGRESQSARAAVTEWATLGAAR